MRVAQSPFQKVDISLTPTPEKWGKKTCGRGGRKGRQPSRPSHVPDNSFLKTPLNASRLALGRSQASTSSIPASRPSFGCGSLGEQAKAEKCPGIEGIKQEHDDFVANESPSQEVLDAFLTGAGARTEHYEIAAYEGLVTMADAMGEDEVAKLPSKNLEEEKTALKKMQTIGKRLAEVGAKATA